MGRIFMTRDQMIGHIREVVGNHLGASEELLAATMGHVPPSFGQMIAFGALLAFKMRFFYIGLTDEHLILVEHDSFDQPVSMKRLPRSEIKSVTIRHGLMMDKLIVDMGEKKPYRFRITRRLQEQTDMIASQLGA